MDKIENRKSKIENSLHIIDCGLSDYRRILQLQQELQEKRRQGKIPDTVLIVEHPPVITRGARQRANQLQLSQAELAHYNIDVVDIRRGGGTTAHNPGQLLLYPILNLRRLNLGISEYIRKLEQIGIDLLLQLGVHPERRKGFPGLWVADPASVKQKPTTSHQPPATKKIASVGVRVSKSITCHGTAINIQNDLRIFDYIVPCGLNGIKMTSVLKETGIRYPMNQVKQKLSHILIRHLSESDKPPASSHPPRNLPPWLHRPLPADTIYQRTQQILKSLRLQTICHHANCPNRGQCWSRATATVLILGNLCTRNCKFCALPIGKPQPPDPTEPDRLAQMAKKMHLNYLVITSVNRDDLPDGGASHFRDCIKKVRLHCPHIKFEILTPDFRHCQAQALNILRHALPFIFAHNIETVPALYPIVRPAGDYQRSLNLLKSAKETYDGIQTKSSIMLGLGETDDQVQQVLKDLRSVGCDRITIGQYLKPAKNSINVLQYIPPAKFRWWRQRALELGFSWVISAPFARSSYLAEQQNPS